MMLASSLLNTDATQRVSLYLLVVTTECGKMAESDSKLPVALRYESQVGDLSGYQGKLWFSFCLLNFASGAPRAEKPLSGGEVGECDP